MSREKKYQAIVLKKQDFGEGDEIVTFFSLEAGKLRGLAKAAKFQRSKLQHALQSLFYSDITLAGRGNLPKIIGAEVRETFAGVRENLGVTAKAMYVQELVLRFTPDEEKNEQLFTLLVTFLRNISSTIRSDPLLQQALVAFQLHFLHTQGLAVLGLRHAAQPEPAGFSNSKGGFVFRDDAADYRTASPQCYQLLRTMDESGFEQSLRLPAGQEAVQEAQELLSGFLSYHLDRQLKSEDLLRL